MPRDNKKRYTPQPFEVVGIRFSNGKKVVELCKNDLISKNVAVYVAKDEIWSQVDNICNTLIEAREVSTENGKSMMSFHVENVMFEKHESEGENE